MEFRSGGGMWEVKVEAGASSEVGNCGRLWKLFDKNGVVKWRNPREAECWLREVSRNLG